MKILLALDGSPHSDMVVKEVARRPWPPGTEVKILGCAHVKIPDVPDPILVYYSMRLELLEAERKRMHQVVNKAAEVLRERGAALKIEAEVLDGSPKDVILNVAEEWGADLIVVGSHGYGPVKKSGMMRKFASWVRRFPHLQRKRHGPQGPRSGIWRGRDWTAGC
ncbi:MAG: universal stress protein [Blastocatellia bacterium]